MSRREREIEKMKIVVDVGFYCRAGGSPIVLFVRVVRLMRSFVVTFVTSQDDIP